MLTLDDEIMLLRKARCGLITKRALIYMLERKMHDEERKGEVRKIINIISDSIEKISITIRLLKIKI
jgi:hypothetical protein